MKGWRAGSIFGHRARRTVAVLFLALAVAPGCAGLSRPELQTLGSELSHHKVDFPALGVEAQRAQAAYLPEAQIRKAYPGTVHVATPGKTAVQYFLERDDKARVQYVVLRGTKNRRNLAQDFHGKVHIDEKTGLPLHSGFEADARVLYADAAPCLKPGYRTVFVGHSLGGAVGAIMALYAMKDGLAVEKIVTFGQPRFTTAEGVAQLSSLPIIRVVDENDIVPLLPPGVNSNGGEGIYEHVGPEVILLEGPHYVYLPSPSATELGVGEFWRDLAMADLLDHRMGNYIARIAAKSSGAVEVAYADRERYAAKKATKPVKAAVAGTPAAP